MNLKNGLPAEIKVRTNIRQPQVTEEIKHSFDVKGQLVQIGDTLYLRYQETTEEDGKPANVTFKIEPDGTIQLIRVGEMRMRLKFMENQKLRTDYRTPYGIMPIETVTKKMHVSLKDQPFSGKINIDYLLFIGSEKLGEYNLELLFTT